MDNKPCYMHAHGIYHLIKTDDSMSSIIAKDRDFNGWYRRQHRPFARILQHHYERLIDLRFLFVVYPNGDDLAANALWKIKLTVPVYIHACTCVQNKKYSIKYFMDGKGGGREIPHTQETEINQTLSPSHLDCLSLSLSLFLVCMHAHTGW